MRLTSSWIFVFALQRSLMDCLTSSEAGSVERGGEIEIPGRGERRRVTR